MSKQKETPVHDLSQGIVLSSLMLAANATAASAPFATAADRALPVGVGDYAQVSDLLGFDLDAGMMQAADRLGIVGNSHLAEP